MKDSNKKRIAFIYEGVQAEENLLANMKRVYLSEFYEVETFQLPADGNIYMLWKQLVDDEFETNVIDILKEMSKEAESRLREQNLKASDFAEIYLFFDYDGHAANFSEETIHEANELCKSLGMPEIKNKWDILERMLLVFRNETEEGILAFFFPVSVLDFLIQPGFRINGQPIITCLSKQDQIFICLIYRICNTGKTADCFDRRQVLPNK